MLAPCLCFTFLAYIFQTVRTQPIACTYSCPFADELGQGLVKSVLATPFESFYSNFECVYSEVKEDSKPHSCFYNKVNGQQALGSPTNHCPQEAAPCSEDLGSFSSLGHPEVPPWVEAGRWLLHLKENHT